MTTPTSREPIEQRTADAFLSLADTLTDDFDETHLMQRLTQHCVDLLDVTDAGVMITDPAGKLHLAASSSDTMRSLEMYELDTDTGPCINAYQQQDTIEIWNLAGTDDRWSALATRARQHDYIAMYAIPMRLREQSIGVLNLYSTVQGPLDPTRRRLGHALADMATIAVLHHRALSSHATHASQLQTAFNTRLVIEQAKGILTERHDISAEQAFDRMRRYARHHHRKVINIAHDITTGILPDFESPPLNKRPQHRKPKIE